MKRQINQRVRWTLAIALGFTFGATCGLSSALAVQGPVIQPVKLSLVLKGQRTAAAKRILAKFRDDRITLHLKNTPAQKVFQVLCRRGNVKFQVVKAEAAVLNQPMNFDVTHADFWSAMRLFLKQSGLVLDRQWIDGKSLVELNAAAVAQNPILIGGFASRAGPILFQPTAASFQGNINFNAAKVTRQGCLDLNACMFIPPDIKHFSVGHIRITRALDILGHSLLPPRGQDGGMFSYVSSSSAGDWRQSLQIAIASPVGNSIVIKLIKGSVTMQFLHNHRHIAFSAGTLQTSHTVAILGCNVEFFPLLWEPAKKRYTMHFSVTPIGFNRQAMTAAQKKITDHDEQVIFSGKVPIVYDAGNHAYFSEYESDCGCHTTGLGKMVYTAKPNASNNGLPPNFPGFNPPPGFPGSVTVSAMAKAKAKAKPEKVVAFGPPVRLSWLAPSSRTVVQVPFEFHNVHLYPQ